MINTRKPLNTNMNISSQQGIPKDIAKTQITSNIRLRTSAITGTLIPSPISKIHRMTGLTIQLAMTQTTITILETKVTVIPHTIMTINHNTTTEM